MRRPWRELEADLVAVMRQAFADVDMRDRKAVKAARERMLRDHPVLFAELRARSEEDQAKLRETLDAVVDPRGKRRY